MALRGQLPFAVWNRTGNMFSVSVSLDGSGAS
jgi:hypothetical protein